MSVNKVTLVGNVGKDPEIRTMNSGDEVASFSLATSERWKDKTTGERKEKSEWHNIVVFNKHLVDVVKNYISKGSKLYIEGQIETRSWEKDGQKKYTTEIVLRPFRGEIQMLDSRGESSQGAASAPQDTLESEIPFARHEDFNY